MAHEMAHDFRQPTACSGVTHREPETRRMSTEPKDELDAPITIPEPKPSAPQDKDRPEAKDAEREPPPALRSFPDYPE